VALGSYRTSSFDLYRFSGETSGTSQSVLGLSPLQAELDALAVVLVDAIMHAHFERINSAGSFEMEILGFQGTEELSIAALSKQLLLLLMLCWTPRRASVARQGCIL
jgi:hypothetical protein